MRRWAGKPTPPICPDGVVGLRVRLKSGRYSFDSSSGHIVRETKIGSDTGVVDMLSERSLEVRHLFREQDDGGSIPLAPTRWSAGSLTRRHLARHSWSPSYRGTNGDLGGATSARSSMVEQPVDNRPMRVRFSTGGLFWDRPTGRTTVSEAVNLGSNPSPRTHDRESSSGRTAVFETVNLGSNPSSRTHDLHGGHGVVVCTAGRDPVGESSILSGHPTILIRV